MQPRIGGFTLIELMLAVTLMAILAAIAIPNTSRLIRKSQEARTKCNLGSLRAVLTLYYTDHEGLYPTDHLESLVPRYLARIPLKFTPIHHPEGNSVSAGASSDQTDSLGDWFYVNDPNDSNFGYIIVNCIHLDSSGKVWSSQ